MLCYSVSVRLGGPYVNIIEANRQTDWQIGEETKSQYHWSRRKGEGTEHPTLTCYRQKRCKRKPKIQYKYIYRETNQRKKPKIKMIQTGGGNRIFNMIIKQKKYYRKQTKSLREELERKTKIIKTIFISRL